MPSSRCAAGSTRSTPRVASRSASSCTSAARRWAPTATTRPVAPSAIRSPREPTAPRAMLEREVAAMVDGFRVSAANALEAGLRRHRAARRARLPARAVPVAAHQPPRRRHRRSSSGDRRDPPAVGSALLGIRLSIDASEDVALKPDELADLLRAVDPLVDWVNVTVGVRTTYVRDMATARPPLLDELARAATAGAGTAARVARLSATPTGSKKRSPAAPTWSAWRAR